ncbi:hypothetical protein [Sulfurisoma sediminicola]|uniref:hypothetical protein n=1 Tax=Sulfurisoma sediminicola TaxID=1381557 RepID=UPI000EAC001B|nr:hypothetical protein [Sulfurisoma sediminicola]
MNDEPEKLDCASLDIADERRLHSEISRSPVEAGNDSSESGSAGGECRILSGGFESIISGGFHQNMQL